MNPDIYAVIYNRKYDDIKVNIFDRITIYAAIPSSPIPQNYYYNEYREEIAKGFLKILLNQLVDKTMVAAIKRE